MSKVNTKQEVLDWFKEQGYRWKYTGYEEDEVAYIEEGRVDLCRGDDVVRWCMTYGDYGSTEFLRGGMPMETIYEVDMKTFEDKMYDVVYDMKRVADREAEQNRKLSKMKEVVYP